MAAIRVVVADDDAAFRCAAVEMLESDARFTVVGAAADGDNTVRVATRVTPDVVLVDVRMPSGGPDVVRALVGDPNRSRGTVPVPRVVAVSAQVGSSTVLGMLRAGAVGFLGKGRLGAQLPDLVARAAAGEVVLAVPGAADVLRRLITEPSDARPGRHFRPVEEVVGDRPV